MTAAAGHIMHSEFRTDYIQRDHETLSVTRDAPTEGLSLIVFADFDSRSQMVIPTVMLDLLIGTYLET